MPLHRLPRTIAMFACLATAGPLDAHEFWIDTTLSQATLDENISADLRVGEDLSGTALPYLDKTIEAMTHVAPSSSGPIEARLGDLPAITDVALKEDGLHILTVVTRLAYIVFETLDEFETYLAYEGLAEIAALHRQRDLGETEIAEEYIRNARALVQVGPVREGDMDRATGMPFEIVVTGTPFATDKRSLTVHLTWQGVGVPDAQIAIFQRKDGRSAQGGTVRTLAQTDQDGYAQFSLDGAGQYLLNAVRAEPVEGPGSVVWQSHWASLAFDIEAER
jgi:uncharacterized GH25 family protein